MRRLFAAVLIWTGRLILSMFAALVLLMLVSDGMPNFSSLKFSELIALLGVLMLVIAGVWSWSHGLIAGVLAVLGWGLVAACTGTTFLGWWFSGAAVAGVCLMLGAVVQEVSRQR